MSFSDIARTAFWLTVAAAISIGLMYVYAVPLAGAPVWAVVASSVLGWAISVPFAALMTKRPEPAAQRVAAGTGHARAR